MSTPRVVVCGLGPARPDLVTAATLAAIERIPRRFLRTRRHPSADVVGEAEAFDPLYESAATFDEVYQGIVDTLVGAAAQHGEVLYAVPGSPTVAESTVERLRADARVEVELLPAVSFLDLAWDRLRVDPLQAGVRLVDGHRFGTEAAGQQGPLLVAQCDNRQVLSEIKLLLGELTDRADASSPSDENGGATRMDRPAIGSSERSTTVTADGPGQVAPGAERGPTSPLATTGGGTEAGVAGEPRPPAATDIQADAGPAGGGGRGPVVGGITVTVLQRLGLPDEVVVTVPWHELDRVVEPDHLTSLYVPRLAAPVAGEVARFAEVVRRLRRECPWDREQTHQSLRRHLLEESYEVLEALDHLDPEAGEGFAELEEELGDLLFQVVFHATLAAEEGHFDLADVAYGIREKLIGRHPHVFGDAEAATAADVMARWEQIKKTEKGRSSVMDGIPVALPALLYAMKVMKRAASEGTDWHDLLPAPDVGQSDAGTAVDAGVVAVAERGDASGEALQAAIGRRLLALVDEAGRAGVDPESALRQAAEQIRDRFREQEERERQVREQHRAG